MTHDDSSVPVTSVPSTPPPLAPPLTPQGSPVPGYASRPATGAKSYALGFLAYIPIPFVGLLIGAIVMIAVYPSAKRAGGIVAENAKRAANWGLTIIAAMAVLVIWVVLLATVFAGNGWSTPLGPVLVYVALCIAHVVVLIVALVQLNSGKVFANPIAIPFLK